MTMKLALSGLLLLALSVGTFGLSKLRPEIMGIGLGTDRDAARARLESIGSLEKEDRKRQQVWAIRDQRISHLLIGFDAESRVRYVTAIARSGGPRIRYAEIADVKSAQRMQNQGNYRFTWEVAARERQPGYVIIAQGHDPQYLDSYSVKMISEKEVD